MLNHLTPPWQGRYMIWSHSDMRVFPLLLLPREVRTRPTGLTRTAQFTSVSKMVLHTMKQWQNQKV
jgi:hypothetical protein